MASEVILGAIEADFAFCAKFAWKFEADRSTPETCLQMIGKISFDPILAINSV
jgi:hypothetical protein